MAAIISEKISLCYRRNTAVDYEKKTVDRHSLTTNRIGKLYGLIPRSIVLEQMNAAAGDGVDTIFTVDYGENDVLPLVCNGTYLVTGDSLQSTIDQHQTSPPETRANVLDNSSMAQDATLIDAIEKQTLPEADIAIIKEQLKKMIGEDFEHVNILIAGKTGTGKSTLINALFGWEFDEKKNENEGAKEGTGRATTMEIIQYPRRGEAIKGPYQHLHLFDTRGIEVDKANETINMIEQFLKDRNTLNMEAKEKKSKPLQEQIHFALYTVLGPNLRFEDIDAQLVNKITGYGIGVIVVLTKAIDEDEKLNELQKCINEQCPQVNVIRVLAKKIEARHANSQAFGLVELVALINSKIPKQCQSAFVAAQKVDRKLRTQRADEMVSTIKMLAVFNNITGAGMVIQFPFLCVWSAKVAKVFDVIPPLLTDRHRRKRADLLYHEIVLSENHAHWIYVIEASGVYSTVSTLKSHVPIIGMIKGRSMVKNYFTKLIRALEELHTDRNGAMDSVTIDDIVTAIKKV